MTSRPLPRNLQISERLIREIAAGLIPHGSKLPTERKMATQYNVAVGTLRKALATLEQNGLLERRHGSGNYVKRQSVVPSIYAEFCLELPDGGGLPTAHILETRMQATPAQALSFGLSKSALRIDRLRELDSQPIALERIWLNGIYTNKINPAETSESLYKYYRDQLGLIISRTEDRIGVASCPAWGSLPNLSTGGIAGYIERRAWDQSGQAAEYSQTWFDPQNSRYINRTENSPNL